jgi:hypothetical protein
MLFLQNSRETEVFKTTEILSPNIHVGPYKSTPNDLHVVILYATNSGP